MSASSVVVERASDKTAAYLRVDIKRRDVLSHDVDSPLPGMVEPATPATERTAGDPPGALDLPDVATTPITVPIKPAKPAPSPRSATGKPAAPPAVNGASGDDISDWI